MGTLGSIYSDDDGDDQSGRGRDLTASVEISRDRLGRPTVVEVPLELPLEGEVVRRAVGPGEQGAAITLHLPATMPERARLRLRGQGEDMEGGRPGDLFVDVRIVEPVVGRVVGAWSPVQVAVAVAVATIVGLWIAL